jgi:hypothetical protein
VFVQMEQNDLTRRIKFTEAQIERETQSPGTDSAAKLAALQDERARLLKQRETTITPQAVETAQRVLFGIKSVVPKTRDTIVLLDRVLFRDQDLQAMSKQGDEATPETAPEAAPETAPATFSAARRGRAGPDFSTQQNMQLQNDRRHSVWWIIGTSLLFEAVCLALAAWHFCTRDF